MAILMWLVLFLVMTGRSSGLYCLCKDGVGDSTLQKALDYACGDGADCSQIQQGGPCFKPNTVKAHCDFAVNSYFQKKGQTAQSCDFAGAATTTSNPSTVSSCVYPSSSSGNTAVPTTNTPGSTTSPSTIPGTTTTTPSPSVFNNGSAGGLGLTGNGFGTDSSGATFPLKNTNNWISSTTTLGVALWFSGIAILWWG